MWNGEGTIGDPVTEWGLAMDGEIHQEGMGEEQARRWIAENRRMMPSRAWRLVRREVGAWELMPEGYRSS